MKRTTSQTNTKRNTRRAGAKAEQMLDARGTRKANASHTQSWGGGAFSSALRLAPATAETTQPRRSSTRYTDPFGGLFAANAARSFAVLRDEVSGDRDVRDGRGASRNQDDRSERGEKRGKWATAFEGLGFSRSSAVGGGVRNDRNGRDDRSASNARFSSNERNTRSASSAGSAGNARSARVGRAAGAADEGFPNSQASTSTTDRGAFRAIRPASRRIEADESGISERERKKRQRAKARADKMFDRQMAGSSNASDEPAEGAPRAAIYETKMGAAHKRSARLQKASQAGPASAKINPAGWFSGLRVNPRIAAIFTAVACVMLVAVFLYMPARDFYQAQRQHDRLATEYAQIEERNQALTDQNQALASDAGMEDAVRRKYGYVVEGEDSAVVTGLSERTMDSIHEAADVQANVLSSSVKPTDEWYTPYLDAFFGVS